jgi:hypothetical protein
MCLQCTHLFLVAQQTCYHCDKVYVDVGWKISIFHLILFNGWGVPTVMLYMGPYPRKNTYAQVAKQLLSKHK